MRIRPTLAAAVLAPLLAAACASQPVTTAQPTSRGKIPPVLVESAADPYAPPKLATCKALAAEQVRLDRALGPESEAPKPNRSAPGASKPDRSPARTLAQWLSSGSAEPEFSTRAMALWLSPDAPKPGQSAQDKETDFAARVLGQWFNAAAAPPKRSRNALREGPAAAAGPDAEPDRSAQDKGAARVAEAGTKTVSAPIETWLPSGAWVRSMSVAEQHSRRVQGAVAAGLARRAYLKGRAQSEGCTDPGLTPPIYLFPAPPHTPSSVAQN